MNFSELQNGSDIRGIAMDDGNGREIDLTGEAVRYLAGAFTKWLGAKLGKESLSLAIGRDSRLTGEALTLEAVEGMHAQGAKCADCGLASTPAMFMSTVLEPYKFDGSIMITASHLPFYRNGMKFFTKEGGLEKSDISEVTALADEMYKGTLAKLEGSTKADMSIDFMENYTGYLCEKIKNGVNAADYEHPLDGLHIIVDAGNGNGGFFAKRVLEVLGADTTGSQFLEPDGHFPNHIPNPENKDAAASIKEATLKSKCDLGIIFDTDVDRAGAVLPDGRTLTRNELIAVLSNIALSEHPGTTIVTDSVTSTGLAEYIKARGGVHRRFKRGYRNVIDEAIRLGSEGIDSQLAIETSGHGAFKENYFLDDGAYLMVKLLIEMGKKIRIADMLEGLKEPAESDEIRFHVTADDVKSAQDKALEILQSSVESGQIPGWSLEKENFEGIRVNADKTSGNGWLLLRKSLHEPILPLNIESDEKGGNLVMAKKLYEILQSIDGVDIQPLKDYIAQ